MSKLNDYNARKGAQVLAYLIAKAPQKRLNVLKLVKLVYLADRESVRRSGFPILDEDRYSMPQGPVNSTTYRYIQGEMESPEWSALISDRENFDVALGPAAADSDWDELSDAEIECLDAVWATFGHMTKYQIRDWTHDPHNVPEWEDPDGRSYPIPLSRMLMAIGVENPIESSDIIEDQRKIKSLLAKHRA